MSHVFSVFAFLSRFFLVFKRFKLLFERFYIYAGRPYRTRLTAIESHHRPLNIGPSIRVVEGIARQYCVRLWTRRRSSMPRTETASGC